MVNFAPPRFELSLYFYEYAKHGSNRPGYDYRSMINSDTPQDGDTIKAPAGVKRGRSDSKLDNLVAQGVKTERLWPQDVPKTRLLAAELYLCPALFVRPSTGSQQRTLWYLGLY